jgi:hypothetical protein
MLNNTTHLGLCDKVVYFFSSVTVMQPKLNLTRPSNILEHRYICQKKNRDFFSVDSEEVTTRKFADINENEY